MKFAVQTGEITNIIGMDEGYALIKEMGFDAVDANLDHLAPAGKIKNQEYFETFRPGMSDLESVAYFKPWADAAKKYGIQNYQAHAPFPSRVYENSNPEYDEYIMDILAKTIRGCASIDCQNLVIHPFFLGYPNRDTAEEEWEYNLSHYLRLAPIAKEYGVTICLENMFLTEPASKQKISAICNHPMQAKWYVDTLNKEAGAKVFGFCLDIGHTNLVRLDVKDFMHEMGDRISCFHVHDNNGTLDQHWAPYTGTVDWNRFIEGLKDIHYDKVLSFETFAEIKKGGQNMMKEQLKYILACGRHFEEEAKKIQ